MSDKAIIREKVDQAVEILNALDIDVWLTFARETSMMPDPVLELILGSDVTWRTAILISRTGQRTAILGFYDAENVRNLGIYDEVVPYHQGISKHLLAILDKLNPRRIAINYSRRDVSADGLTLGNYHTLLDILEDTPYVDRLISAEDVIAALRGRKSEQEVKRVIEAVDITEKLFDEVEGYVRPGMTQHQIAEFVHERIDGMGLGYAWDKPYNPIVTCGPDSAYGHAVPGDVPMEKGHTFHMDLGVKVNDYCSDLQRMWYVLDRGESTAPDEVLRAFEVVRGAIVAGEKALAPGVPGWQVDAAARKHIVDGGYPEYMHAFGHLLGRDAHDGATVLGPRWERYAGICELPVEVGNIFTLELHVIIPGRGIMSLEEDVLVRENDIQHLSNQQTALRYIRS